MTARIARSTFSTRIGVATLGSVAPELQLAIALGRLDDDAPVDPIVHELLHHEAANSAVNVALQYRWLAVLRRLLSGGEDDPEPAADLAASEALLQPLAEGLAHFAEFDCAVESVPLTAADCIAVRLLALKRGVTDVRAASLAGKLAPGQVRRRADVLSHRLYPRTMNDAYLLGYLVAKAAWASQLEGGGGLRAGDFLQFLHYWIYEDWRLAELLLQPGAGGRYAVVERLAERVRGLLDGAVAERAAAFHEDKAARERRGMLPRGPEEREHGPFAGLGLDQREVLEGQYALTGFYRAQVGPNAPVAGAAPLLTAIAADDPAALAFHERNPVAHGADLRALDFVLELPQRKRALGTLLDAPLELEVVDGGSVRALRVPDGEWHAPPDGLTATLPDGRHAARLVGVMMSTASPWSLYCVVLVSAGVCAAWWHGEGSEQELREVGEVIAHEHDLERLSGLTMERLARGLMFASERADEATAAIAMALREALGEGGWGPLFAASPALRDSGLRTRLPGRVVGALALTGLVNTYSHERAEVAERLAEQGHDLDELIAACEREARLGVRLLDVDTKRVRARV